MCQHAPYAVMTAPHTTCCMSLVAPTCRIIGVIPHSSDVRGPVPSWRETHCVVSPRDQPDRGCTVRAGTIPDEAIFLSLS
jgi:hypothetical protein